MASTTYLITGANRGVGLGLTTHYLSRPDTTVIAAVRDPSKSAALQNLPKGQNSSIHVVTMDSADPASIKAAVETLPSKNINAIDVVIANAGIANAFGAVRDSPISDYTSHFQVNTIGPLALFQATAPFLDRSTSKATARFAVITSILGSIGGREYPNLCAYGTSKTAVNSIIKSIAIEEKNIIAVAVHPGWLQTDMGNSGAQALGMEQAPTSVQEGVDGVIKAVDSATKEQSGQFLAYDGKGLPW